MDENLYSEELKEIRTYLTLLFLLMGYLKLSLK